MKSNKFLRNKIFELNDKVISLIPKSKILKIVLSIVALTLLIHLGHALTFDRMVQYKEIKFESHNWPKELNGYRIAFVSDIHLADEERLWRIRDHLNKNKLTFFFLEEISLIIIECSVKI